MVDPRPPTPRPGTSPCGFWTDNLEDLPKGPASVESEKVEVRTYPSSSSPKGNSLDVVECPMPCHIEVAGAAGWQPRYARLHEPEKRLPASTVQAHIRRLRIATQFGG